MTDFVIERLPNSFTKKAQEYVKLLQNEHWYVYGVKPDKAKEFSYYEVFRTMKVKDKRVYENGEWKKIDGVKVENYPKDEDFGEWAFCCKTLDKALRYSGREGLLI